jgi:hypothetical protein
MRELNDYLLHWAGTERISIWHYFIAGTEREYIILSYGACEHSLKRITSLKIGGAWNCSV